MPLQPWLEEAVVNVGKGLFDSDHKIVDRMSAVRLALVSSARPATYGRTRYAESEQENDLDLVVERHDPTDRMIRESLNVAEEDLKRQESSISTTRAKVSWDELDSPKRSKTSRVFSIGLA